MNFNKIQVFSRFALVLRRYSQYERPMKYITKQQLQWFPGHIHKGITKMNETIYKSDIIVEIHDARIPFTGRTEILNSFSQVKPRILVFNKCDLIPYSKVAEIRNKIDVLNGEGSRPIDVYFTQLNDPGRQMELLQSMSNAITKYIGNSTKSSIEHYVLVAGLPNVGKSTLINSLRNWAVNCTEFTKARSKKPVKVANYAGVTRAVSEKILLSEGPPRTYILDTPGIWEPAKENIESVLKLALCGCLNFTSIYRETVIDYMLYWLNMHNELAYVKRYNMPGPTDDLIVFLTNVCANKGLVRYLKRYTDNPYKPQTDAAVNLVFTDFSMGKLGRFVLDDLDDYLFQDFKESDAHNAPLGTVFTTLRPVKKHFPFSWAKPIKI